MTHGQTTKCPRTDYESAGGWPNLEELDMENVHDADCEQRGRHYWTDCQCEARQSATAKAIEAWVDECDESEA